MIKPARQACWFSLLLAQTRKAGLSFPNRRHVRGTHLALGLLRLGLVLGGRLLLRSALQSLAHGDRGRRAGLLLHHTGPHVEQELDEDVLGVGVGLQEVAVGVLQLRGQVVLVPLDLLDVVEGPVGADDPAQALKSVLPLAIGVVEEELRPLVGLSTPHQHHVDDALPSLGRERRNVEVLDLVRGDINAVDGDVEGDGLGLVITLGLHADLRDGVPLQEVEEARLLLSRRGEDDELGGIDLRHLIILNR